MDREQALNALNTEIRACTACPLYRGRTNAVPGDGPVDALIMFVGEAPGFYEDQQGIPFVGAAGRFLNELLEKSGIDRKSVYITNVIKCRPRETGTRRSRRWLPVSTFSTRRLRSSAPKSS